jgi:methionyl-tRNA synthetase
MFKDKLNSKFEKFYETKDKALAKELSNEILNMLNEKGLIVYEKIAGYDSLYIQVFDKYLSKLGVEPNPFYEELDFIRFGLISQFKYDI